MKFRLKMTLCMLGLMAVLFGIGGGFLITVSLRETLTGKRIDLYNSYQMAIGTIQIIGSAKKGLNDDEASDILRQLAEANKGYWVNVRLYTDDRVIYENTEVELEPPETHPQPGSCTLSYDTQGDRRLLVLNGTLSGDEGMYFDMVSDISGAFAVSRRQEQIYRYVFCLLIALCALLSYSLSYLLTMPLTRLSKASRAIAEGKLSYRTRVKGSDEIGELARDFDAMADKLQDNISELEDSIKRQDRFVGSFAHEMKTPMTSIIGYADLVRSGILSPQEERQAAEYIFSEGKRLENLSRKLLEIIVLKEGVSLRPCSPGALIGELADALSPIYASQGIVIHTDCQKGEAMLEPDLFKSLAANLLDNARKAMEGKKGSIAISCRMTDEGCCLTVRDEGRGMPPEAIAHVTEAFYRVDKSRARRQGGVGLGLALCSQIVRLHGGEISFESREGQGTAVTALLKGGRA